MSTSEKSATSSSEGTGKTLTKLAPGQLNMSAIEVALLIAASVILNTLILSLISIKLVSLQTDVLHLSVSDMATLALISGIPAYLRPFMGTAADLFPLLGLHRKSYYFLSWLTFAAGLLAIAFTPTREYSYGLILGLIIVYTAGMNMLFVMMDSIMVSIGNKTGTIGKLQSIQQGLPMVCSLVFASHMAGFVAQNWTYQHCFLLAGVFALLGCATTLLVHEKTVDRRDEHLPNTLAERHLEKLQDKKDSAAHAKTLGVTLSSPGLWACLGFVFYLILTPGLGNAQQVYSLTVLHFSKQFFGDLGMYSSAGSIAATLLFLLVGKKMPTAGIVWGAFLGDLLGYPLLLMYKDHTSAIVVSFLTAFIGMIYLLCLLTFAAKVTPKGVEASIYSLFIAITTFAGNFSNQIGASTYDHFGPHSHHSVTFGWNVGQLVGMAFTAVAIVFIPFLPHWTRDAKFEREEAAALANATVAL